MFAILQKIVDKKSLPLDSIHLGYDAAAQGNKIPVIQRIILPSSSRSVSPEKSVNSFKTS